MSCLLCVESGVERRAIHDRFIRDSSVVFRNLMRTEQNHLKLNYVGLLQAWMTPEDRRSTMHSMIELSEFFELEDTVFPLAVSILDRFLSITKISREQFHPIAYTSLLMAAKLRSVRTLPIRTLRQLTGHTVTAAGVAKWERLLAQTLKWEVESVTPNDFVDHILNREPAFRKICASNLKMVRSHAHVLAHIALTDSIGITMKPSTIASAAILSALQGLRITSVSGHQLCSRTGASYSTVECLAKVLEKLLDEYTRTSQSEATACCMEYVTLS